MDVNRCNFDTGIECFVFSMMSKVERYRVTWKEGRWSTTCRIDSLWSFGNYLLKVEFSLPSNWRGQKFYSLHKFAR
jgi:hypothetical protein